MRNAPRLNWLLPAWPVGRFACQLFALRGCPTFLLSVKPVKQVPPETFSHSLAGGSLSGIAGMGSPSV